MESGYYGVKDWTGAEAAVTHSTRGADGVGSFTSSIVSPVRCFFPRQVERIFLYQVERSTSLYFLYIKCFSIYVGLSLGIVSISRMKLHSFSLYQPILYGLDFVVKGAGKCLVCSVGFVVLDPENNSRPFIGVMAF